MGKLRELFVWLWAVLSWLFSMAVLFLVIYAAIRLALTHDRRSQVPQRDVADAELRERVAAERAAQKREAEERAARRREAEGTDDV
ncbi:hypothetical protein AB0F88_37390 [Streptosporangium sp. NPDC023963]|uniref:hypothetical protein n=1 Tax=Streptosporangium sp. NPDC023963 TaxID=3155608 RepID=UPI00343F2982